MSELRTRAWFCPTRGLHAGGDICAECEPVDVLMVSEHERVVAERDRYREALQEARTIARGVLRGEQDNERNA